jgi:PKD repeat protein
LKKLWSICLVASVLGWLLAWDVLPCGAYYPPLQATGYASGSGVWFSVTLPQGGGVMGGGGYLPPLTVSNFTNNSGVMAWVVGNGSSFSVETCTFDPFLETFVQGSQGDYTGISQLTVNDGVVAFLADLSSGNRVIGYTTYDPDKGTWINGQTEWAEVSYFLEFLVKEGVVAWVAAQGGGTLVEYAIRDPRSTSWTVDGTWYSSPDYIGVDYFAITDATVYWDRADINWFAGYRSEKVPIYNYYGDWFPFQKTKVFSYFVAQPDLGSSPLWVWFTDMSIGGTSWSWKFDDGGTTTARSPYHTYTSGGSFEASQTVTGPNGSDTYFKTIIVRKGITSILNLLLND